MRDYESRTRVVIEVTPSELEAMIQDGVTKALQGVEHEPNTALDNKWLTREETADMLRVSFPTLRRLEKENILTPTRLGRRVLYARRDVDTCLSQGYAVNRRRRPE